MATTSPWADLYLEHPIPASVGVDPLNSLHPRHSSNSPRAAQEALRLRIGYAAVWERVQERTWSGSTWYLWDALRQFADVSDLGVQYPASRCTGPFCSASRI